MKSDVYQNIEQAQDYLAKLREHIAVLIEHTRGTDNMAATRAMELAEQAIDVLENGF